MFSLIYITAFLSCPYSLYWNFSDLWLLFSYFHVTLHETAQTRRKRRTCVLQCPIWKGFSNKTLSLRITPWLSPPLWQVLTVVLLWQLPIWGLERRGKGREVRERGQEIWSSVVASEMRGLYKSSQALYLWAPPFFCTNYLFPTLFSLTILLSQVSGGCFRGIKM